MNVGDEVEVAQKKTRIETEVELARLELKDILGTKGGRNLIWKILGRCELYSCLGPSEAPLANYFNGKRSIGVWLLEECLMADPTSEVKMKQEAMDKETLRKMKNG